MQIAKNTNTKAGQFVNTVTQPKYMLPIAVAGIGVGYAAMRHVGVGSISEFTLSTEQAVSSFSLLAGIGGAAAQIIAGQRLSKYEKGEISIKELVLPLGISIGASAGSAFLLPGEL